MSETTTSTTAETLSPAVRVSADGRRTLVCPEVTAGELRCWKLHNPDPTAAWDFWLMLVFQSVGPIAKLTQVVPLPGGGYRELATRTNHTSHESVESIEAFKSKSDSFGFIRIDKSVARKSYAELRTKLFSVVSTVRDFDADGDPVPDAVDPANPPWPDLPGDGEAAAVLRRLSSLAPDQPLEDLGAHIHFPSPVAREDGDYDVAMGEVLPAAASTAKAVARRPGIRIEVTQREGVPAAIVNDFFLVDESGRERRLYGDRCVQKTHIRVLQIIEKKRDEGFFRSRHKLTEIRKVLRVDDLTWEET